jgi:hypothetical protein
MKKILILLSSFMLLQSCKSSPCDELKDQIETALNSGSEVSSEEASAMKTFILANQKDIIDCNKSLVNGEAVADDELLKLIKKSKVYRKLSKAGEVKIDLSGTGTGTKTTIAVNEIMPKLYLERSGSMVYYDSPQSGDFRSVLTSLLSNFNSVNNKKNIIYVVNNNVYDCPLDFKGLVQSKDIFAATKTGGNETFTDFDLIFKRILGDLKQGEVSILLSDLIYSTPSMNGVSNSKILDAAEKLTLNVFQDFSKDISVLVLKFNGHYGDNGVNKSKYYPHNQSPQEYSGSRPYYAVFFAKNETMNNFMNDEKYNKIRTWKDYTKFENFYFYSNDDKVKNPFYTIRLKDPDNAGRYYQESDEKKLHEKGVHAIEDINHDKDGKLSINIVVDLSNLHIPNDIKVDTSNYKVESNQNFVLEKVTPLDGNAEGTHKVTLTTKTKRGGDRNVIIKFKKIFPPKWIIDSQSDDDSDVKKSSFASTTFGILNMMRGIHQAYDTDGSQYLFTLKINLKN